MSEHVFTCSDCGAKSSTRSKEWFVISRTHDDRELCCDCFLDRMKYDTLPITFNHKLEQKKSKRSPHLELSLSTELSGTNDGSIISFTFNDSHDLQDEQLFNINVSGATLYKLNDSNELSYYLEGVNSRKDFGEFPLYCVDPPLDINAKFNSNYRATEKIRFKNANRITYTITNDDLQSYNNNLKCTKCGESMFRNISFSTYAENLNTEYLCGNCLKTNIHVEISDITFNRLVEIENPYYKDEGRHFDDSYDYDFLLEFEIRYSTRSDLRLLCITSMNLIEKEIVPYLQGTVTYPTHTEQVQTLMAPLRNTLSRGDNNTHDIYVGVKEDFLKCNLELQSPENESIKYTVDCNPNIKDSQLGLLL